MKAIKMLNVLTLAILAAAVVMASWACQSDNLGFDAGNGDGTGGDPYWDGDVLVTPDGEDVLPDYFYGPKGAVEGVVMSPESGDPMVTNFPVSGALVYLVKEPPGNMPDGAYCHRCVELSETVPSDFSAADGTFRIANVPQGSWVMVVEKGDFRKVSLIDVIADTVTTTERVNTTFPKYHAPPNDFTPRMAVALGSFDIMEDIIAKMGLCPLDAEYHWSGDPCDHVDFYGNGGGDWTEDYTPFESLLRNLDLMKQYHVIFVPCSGSTTDDALEDPTVLSNIRSYVDAGGKWYIADWSYDFVEQAFPEFLDFEGDDYEIGSADWASGSFDSIGRAVDTNLRDWLLAIGEPADSINFEENWDCIQTLGTVPGVDEDGNPISITPYTWAEGPITRSHECMAGNAPLTMTFPFGCGKVLFTTYHTVGQMGGEGRAALLTQEKILFYLILEIGLCTDEVIII